MRYILNPYIALRSWMLVPYAYYIKGERNAKGLTAEEFAFLTECDGRSELPDEAEYEGLHKYVSGFSPLRTLTAQISPAGPFVYEADWDLGDKVTVQARDAAVGLSVRMDARILTIEETYERGGQSLRVTFGKEEPTIGQALRQAQRQTVR
mgnify:CR=1 FL=1